MELILVLNTGSSSDKCCLFEGNQKAPIWHVHHDWTEGRVKLETLLETLPKRKITAIGHRVVLGGESFKQVTRITPEVKEKIQELAYLAPLHNPANLRGIEVTEALYPGVPQYAVFDTAFHTTMPEVAATYPLPFTWREKGVRRYGFHGISHEYCSQRASAILKNPEKMIICHLGAGASLCAVKNGKSLDTTMGMTPLEGLMMASRSGSVDPGVLLHLLRNENFSPETLDKMLNHESGLLGVSGISEDLRSVQKAAENGDRHAHLAVEMFVHRLAGHIGMMLASLRGLDALIFTAGIGENSALIREKTCAYLSFLGLVLDQKKIDPPLKKRGRSQQQTLKLRC